MTKKMDVHTEEDEKNGEIASPKNCAEPKIRNGKVRCGMQMPVSIYPQDYVSTLRRELDVVKGDIISGKRSVFNSPDSLLDEMESKE